MKRFNRRLRELCKEKKISQLDLAEAIGTSQSAISKYFNSQLPNIEIALRIAEALRVSPYEFIDAKRVKENPEAYGKVHEILSDIEELSEEEQEEIFSYLKKKQDART